MRKLGYLVAALVLAAVGGGGWYVKHLVFDPTEVFETPRVVSIRKGASMTVAARELAREGIVRSQPAFVFYAGLTGRAKRLKPGDYAFKGGEAMPAVLTHLVNGDFMVVTVTIPEGMTVHQIGERLEQAGLVCENEFDSAARGGQVAAALGLGPLGTEGFLFPATYRFSPLAKTDQILGLMLERFFAVLTPAVEQRLFELDLTAREMVTMASIVEKEAHAPQERPIIASVFYNRLKLGMPLQSDPTAQYNLQGDSQRAATAVRMPSAFNTYEIAGLPPGPIANPGLSSIRAALYPAHTDYLYFVARNDGTHIFSRSFAEHQRAIAEVKRVNALSQGLKG
jgi:peptidoglycan lytic transglycosylase G